MRIVSRTTRSLLDKKREQSLRRRAAAGTLAKSNASVEQVRVLLQFSAGTQPSPADQVHDLYPSAPAFFEFACPYGDCDGSFDLKAVAQPMLRKSQTHGEGRLHCNGTRAAAAQTREPCDLRADFWINARYQSPRRATG